MPSPTIDLTEVANGVTAILAQRDHEAHAQQRNAEAQREAEAQRQTAQAAEHARMQRATAMRELGALEMQQSELHASLQAKGRQYGALRLEILEFEAKFNVCLRNLANKKKALGL